MVRVLVRVGMLLGLVLGGLNVARADTFNFSYTGAGISSIGTLTATNNNNNTYTITGISGTRNGVTIAGLTSYGGNNNILFYPGTPLQLDTAGFSYSDGTSAFHVYDNGGGGYTEYQGGTSGGTSSGGHVLTGFSASPAGAPAPIPGGGLLSFLVLGFAGLGYRRKWIGDTGRVLIAACKTKQISVPA